MKTVSKSVGIMFMVLVSFSAHDVALASDLDVTGYWEGVIIRDGKSIVVSVEFTKTNDQIIGVITAREWLPDLVYTGPVTVENDEVAFLLRGFGTARLNYDSFAERLSGKIPGRDNASYSVHMSRVMKPIPAKVITTEYDIRHGETTIKAEIIRPPGKGPHPAVVFFQGRGEGIRHTYRPHAEMLARRGVAGVIADRRGQGDTSGDVNTAVFQDLVDDGLAIINLVKSVPEIDATQIGIYGYSSGGWVVPHVAANNPDVAFVITAAGPAVSLRNQQIQVIKQLMKRSVKPFTDEDYAAAVKHMHIVLDYTLDEKGWEKVVASNEIAKNAAWGEHVDILDEPMSSDISWLRRYNSDPTEALKQIKVPFLAIFAENDYIVPDEDNGPILKKLLNEAGNSDLTIVVLPKTSHGMYIRPRETDENGNRVFTWWKIAPGFNRTIVEWTLAHVKIAE